MEPPLQPLGDPVDAVKVTLRGRPPRLRQVDLPAPLAGPEEIHVAANKRGPFLEVKGQGLGFQALGCFSTCPEHPPPGYGTAVVAHHGAHLPRTARAKEFGNIPIGYGCSGGDEPDQ
jgi:hypothetical protein